MRLTKLTLNGFASFKSKFVMIGGGDATTGVSSILRLKGYSRKEFTILEEKNQYIYQSGLTMVGGGMKSLKSLQTTLEGRYNGMNFKIDPVIKIDPANNKVYTKENDYEYEVLVIASGIHPKRDSIKGLQEALDNPDCPVATNYFPESAEKMSRIRENF